MIMHSLILPLVVKRKKNGMAEEYWAPRHKGITSSCKTVTKQRPGYKEKTHAFGLVLVYSAVLV